MTVHKHPDTVTAMRQLLEQIRSRLPVGAPESSLCRQDCMGCPKKLMAYMEQELDGWQMELDSGTVPTLGDINKLARSATKIYKVMKKNGLAG